MSYITSILFNKVGKLSDIEYLMIKEFGGKLKHDEGSATATGTLCSVTAGSGKDLYVARAKVSASFTSSFPSATVELQANGVTIETVTLKFDNDQSAYEEYEFKNVGHKVDATQVLRLQITALTSTLTVEGFIECVEETDGASPRA